MKHGIRGLEESGVLFGQNLAYRRVRPEVIPSFHPFGVGIERRGEGAFRRAHLPIQKRNDVPAEGFEERIVQSLERIGSGMKKKRLVIQHLLEMRDAPSFVDRIPEESAAQMVVNSPVPHAPHGNCDHIQRVLLPELLPITQEEGETIGRREFRRSVKAAPRRVERLLQRSVRTGHFRLPGAASAGRHGPLPERLYDGIGRLFDRVTLCRPQPAHPRNHVDEAGLRLGTPFRKVGRRKKRLAFGRQENVERPPASFVENLAGRHIRRVDVGALFPVDFHRNERSVQQRGHLLVPEALALHHMAPVARGIAAGEKDGFVFPFGHLERFIPPGKPRHGIVRVLLQVRALLFRKTVRRHQRIFLSLSP